MHVCCASCRVPLRPHRNGVAVIIYANFGPDQIWAADLWICPLCRVTIIDGWSREHAEHYEHDFAQRLARALERLDTVKIFENGLQRDYFETRQ